jgi:hypothetical protein
MREQEPPQAVCCFLVRIQIFRIISFDDGGAFCLEKSEDMPLLLLGGHIHGEAQFAASRTSALTLPFSLIMKRM